MKIIQWTGRILLSLALLVLVVCAALILLYSSWKNQRITQLEAGSQVVQTDVGPIEFTALGEGPAILILHGAPGGYDQARLIGQPLAEAGFRVIAPSRPGYLKTPLESGLLFDDQADLMAALLDSQEVDSTIVIGFSTGASVAVEFAHLFPGRVNGLVLISPVTQTYNRFTSSPPKAELLEEKALMWTTGDMGAWALFKASQLLPDRTLSAVLAPDTELDGDQLNQLVSKLSDDPARLKFFQDLLLSLTPLSGRESGTRNDLLMLKAAKPMDLSDLSVPTLIVSSVEEDAPEWTSLKKIFSTAPQIRELRVENAGRLVWFGSTGDQVTPEILTFIQSLE